MADQSANPFIGLDKALLRSTKTTTGAPSQQPGASAKPTQPTVPAPDATITRDARVHARTRVHAPTRMRAEPQDAGTQTLVEVLYRVLQNKQHLATSTFRFRPQELDELDLVFAAVAKASGRKVSKNDLVRLGLVWLLEEYKRGGSSVLARVLRRL